ncbi:MAG TPA: hypothetical protein VFN89_03275, partial [Solirubrobacterales bacterium]|nr:hypothetical protein [Solirubrobacterales bacterium]
MRRPTQDALCPSPFEYDKEPETMDTFAERSHRSLKLRTLALVVAILGTFAAFGAASASADFGVESFDVTFANQDGTPATQAGSHPFEAVESFGMNTRPDPTYGVLPEEPTRDVTIDQVPGVVGDSRPTPTCSTLDLITIDTSLRNACPNDSAVGYVNVHLALFGALNLTESVYNLETTPGVPARLGFTVLPVPITVNVGVNEGGSHNLVASLRNTSQALNFLGAETILWGVPSDSAHDPYRGRCLELFALPGEAFSNGSCPVTLPPKPFLTLPTSCSGPQESSIEADSWFHPGVLSRKTALTHDFASPPNPQGFTGCGRLGFAPSIETRTTSDSAETGTGLDFSLNFEDEGLVSTTGLSQSTAKKAEVTLPEGVTINPSIGEGLGVCTPQEIERETATTAPGEGCPNASKIGTLEVQTPLLPEAVGGSVFLAEQDNPETTEPGAENPFDSLIALYLVVKSTDLGINVKLPMKVEPDPKTGRLVASVEDIPQIPFSHFNFHFKEGVRAAMVTPPTCGSYTTEGKFWPWSDPTNPRTVTSSFEITKGVGGGPCPPGGIPPFDPHFEAGAVNNNAGSFSPFDMRITREDGEQDMTKFSAVLPPGELGSLAGVSKCPDSAIATAKGKTGRQELASPSCPANSLIGHTLAGAGVGSALTYVGGQIYLGGPYHGDPLSVIAITPAVAGPFDAGTIVVQEALTLNPKTAEVEVDGAHSDPIPHIVKGIVLKLRD